ncbi:MAG: hypothetical protein U0Q18_28895 [Bryobacteraceae bacterium]
MKKPGWLPAALGSFILLTFWTVHATLNLPWISDDFNHLQLIAEIRAGLRPSADLATLPYHGQTLLFMRLLFWLTTLGSAFDPARLRIVIVLVHAAGATGCAYLCARWTGSKWGGWFAGALYAVAAGFAGEVFWAPSSAVFCLAGVFLLFAFIPLANSGKSARRALAVSLSFVLFAFFGLNGAAFAALGLIVYCRLVMPPTPLWRKWAPCSFAALAAVLLIAARANDAIHSATGAAPVSLEGIKLGLWLLLTAPLRFFRSWTTLPLPGFRWVVQWSPAAWIVLLAPVPLMDRAGRRILAAIWTPAILLALLVGAARNSEGPGFLFTNDRYYYCFLFPLTLHCMFVRSVAGNRLRRVPGPIAVAFAVALIAAGAITSRAHYLAAVPNVQFAMLSKAVGQGRVLPRLIAESNIRPLLLADGPLPYGDTYMGEPTLAALLYSEFPKGIPGVRLTRDPIDAAQSAAENALLQDWARAAGMHAVPGKVEDGRLQANLSQWVDFGRGAQESAVVSGFSWWEGNFRWMTAHGAVRLAAAPGDLVVQVYAAPEVLRRVPIRIRATVNEISAGEFAVLPGLHEYRLPTAITHGREAVVELTASRTWKARDLDPQTLDERELSIALLAIGFR